jgi:hypothetical protein
MIMAVPVHPLPFRRAIVLKVRPGNPMYEWKIIILPGGLEEVSNLTQDEEELLE